MSTETEVAELLDQMISRLTEYCGKVHIVVETLSPDPSSSGTVLLSKYGSLPDVLGLLEYAKEKAKWNLRKDFEQADEDGGEETEV